MSKCTRKKLDLSSITLSAAGSTVTTMLSAATATAAGGALEAAAGATLEASPAIAFEVGLRVRLPNIASVLPSSPAPAPSPADECGNAAARSHGEAALVVAARASAGAAACPAEASWRAGARAAISHTGVSLPWMSWPEAASGCGAALGSAAACAVAGAASAAPDGRAGAAAPSGWASSIPLSTLPPGDSAPSSGGKSFPVVSIAASPPPHAALQRLPLQREMPLLSSLLSLRAPPAISISDVLLRRVLTCRTCSLFDDQTLQCSRC
jgi:hypothetical protein